MPLRLNDKYLSGFITEEDYKAIAPKIEEAYNTTKNKTGKGSDFLGWLDLCDKKDGGEYNRIVAAASKIKDICDVFIVIGIGGSYLGARAAIEFLYGQKRNDIKHSGPEIYFVGCDLNPQTISDTLALCEGKRVCLNVISKSGTTTEPAVAFRIFREYMEKRYGEEESAKRIFVTTDESKGKLKELSDRKGYETFIVPDDVGGRFSVLSPVGLLPIAVSGADIGALLDGANDARKKYSNGSIYSSDCAKYAAIRNILASKGKKSEVFVSYDNALAMTGEWWKQLYGESEGKEGKGLFPASVSFTTDLHSLGQFVQQGTPILFETVLSVRNLRSDLTIPFDPEDPDSLNYIAGKQLSYVNSKAMEATCIAHTDGGVPNLLIEVDTRSEYDFGYLVFFFELACAISGYTLGVNPFDQPGVEAYKKNMFALLGKEGEEYDRIREKLQK